uniref:ITPR-interacting domain-containing protein n=1 Tax=Anopheles epiroticus TaxID=199890 RepID=A0A182PHL4_9DIPT
MEIEHLLRYLDAEKESKDVEERSSQLHRIRSRHIIRSRVRYWLNDIVDEMRKKSPASVQKWVDSIQIPTGTSTGEPTGTDASAIAQNADPTSYVPNVSRTDQLAPTTVEGIDGQGRPIHSWPDTTEIEPEQADVEPTGEMQEQGESTIHGLPTEPQSSLTTSTPKAIKLEECTKQLPAGESTAAPSSGLSIRNFLSKKSLLGKFNRSGSNLDQQSPVGGAGEGVAEHSEHDKDAGGVSAAPSSPFVVGKSKINEFYDKLNMNKAKYGLMKAKTLDIRHMLSGGSRESDDARKVSDLAPSSEMNAEFEGDLEPVVSESEHERSVSPQQHEPLEVSVVDVDHTDPYEFSFDESFPRSDELIPGMISEEDEEEKENILDGASVMPGYGYDGYLNPPKPKTHRMGIGRIGRSSSENPRATARRYNLMEIGRSFSEMNDDDDSFAISECNNSCPNPSSLNTSSSINNGSSINLTRSVPVSPIPRTSSKLSIQQDPSQHQLHQHQQQQQHQQQPHQSSPRRRSTMLVKDNSLQSDSSRCSSVESLLNARKPDPEKILLNLGFGPAPHSTDVLAKIPKRFLKPSQVRGVDTEAFLRQQQLSMHIHENSVLGYRGLVGNPHIPPSMIVAKIMERFQENDSKTRLSAAGVPLLQPDSRNSSGPPSPVPMTRHASLATADGRLKY